MGNSESESVSESESASLPESELVSSLAAGVPYPNAGLLAKSISLRCLTAFINCNASGVGPSTLELPFESCVKFVWVEWLTYEEPLTRLPTLLLSFIFRLGQIGHMTHTVTGLSQHTQQQSQTYHSILSIRLIGCGWRARTLSRCLLNLACRSLSLARSVVPCAAFLFFGFFLGSLLVSIFTSSTLEYYVRSYNSLDCKWNPERKVYVNICTRYWSWHLPIFRWYCGHFAQAFSILSTSSLISPSQNSPASSWNPSQFSLNTFTISFRSPIGSGFKGRTGTAVKQFRMPFGNILSGCDHSPLLACFRVQRTVIFLFSPSPCSI